MITSVYIDTDELVFQLHSVSDDAQKALEWVRSFRDTLMFGARIANPLPFAMECMAMSEGFSASGVLGKLRAAARKRLNDEGIEATPETIDAEIVRTQGADAVREMTAKIEHANRLKAEIRRRKFTAAAATREGADVTHSSESCSLERTTGCNPLTADGDIREDSQAKPDGSAITRNETRAHDALEPSANLYGVAPHREAGDVSATDSKNSEARERQRAGENSVRRVEKVSTSPVRSSGPAKHPHGEFGNVMLTDDEFAKLCEKCADADSLITELDQYIESQGKTKKYKSHYATLLNWSRRKAQEAKPKQGYLTSDDISKKNYQESKARLEAMFSKGRETA